MLVLQRRSGGTVFLVLSPILMPAYSSEGSAFFVCRMPRVMLASTGGRSLISFFQSRMIVDIQ